MPRPAWLPKKYDKQFSQGEAIGLTEDDHRTHWADKYRKARKLGFSTKEIEVESGIDHTAMFESYLPETGVPFEPEKKGEEPIIVEDAVPTDQQVPPAREESLVKFAPALPDQTLPVKTEKEYEILSEWRTEIAKQQEQRVKGRSAATALFSARKREKMDEKVPFEPLPELPQRDVFSVVKKGDNLVGVKESEYFGIPGTSDTPITPAALEFEKFIDQNAVVNTPVIKQMFALLSGVAKSDIMRHLMGQVAPPREGETEEEKRDRYSTMFKEIDQIWEKESPFLYGIGKFGGEALQILITSKIIGAAAAPFAGVSAFLNKSRGLAKMGLTGVAFGGQGELGEQLSNDQEIDATKILVSAAENGLAFLLADAGFTKIAKKVVAFKRLQNIRKLGRNKTQFTKEELQILDGFTDEVTKAINPENMTFQDVVALASNKESARKKLRESILNRQRGKTSEERVFKKLAKPVKSDELKTAGELALETSKPQILTVAETALKNVDDIAKLEARQAAIRESDEVVMDLMTGKPMNIKKAIPESSFENTANKAISVGTGGLGKKKVKIDLLGTLKKFKPKKVKYNKKDKELTFNLKRFSPEAAESIKKVFGENFNELVGARGPKMTHEKIRQLSKSNISDGMHLIENLDAEQIIIGASQVERNLENLAAKRTFYKGFGLPSEFDNAALSSELIKSLGLSLKMRAFSGRMLNSFNSRIIEGAIGGGGKFKDFLKLLAEKDSRIGALSKKMQKAFQETDFNDPSAVSQLYHDFAKPTFLDLLEQYRYANMLSSPETHIINFGTNTIQSFMPIATKLVNATVDFALNKGLGTERQHFAGESWKYVSGAYRPSNVKAAFRDAWRNFKEGVVTNPDLGVFAGLDENIFTDLFPAKVPPAGIVKKTGAFVHDKYMTLVKALSASDGFWKRIIQGGEIEALNYKNLKGSFNLTKDDIIRMSDEKALYWIFRQKLFPEGQGVAFNALDKITSSVMKARKVKGVGRAVNFLVPFVLTPTNILKQGIEFSPLGLSNLITKEGFSLTSAGAVETISKSVIGTTVMGMAGIMAANNQLTWDVPTDPEEAAMFWGAKMQPYSMAFKIEGKTYWYSYKYLGPLSYPMMMAASMKYHYDKFSAGDIYDNNLVKMVGMSTLGTFGFFGDLPYAQGVGDLALATQGDERAWAKFRANPVRQLVPYTALQSWFNRMNDDFLRKPDTWQDYVTAGIFNQYEKVPARLDPRTGKAIRKPEQSLRLASRLSPTNITVEDEQNAKKYKKFMSLEERNKRAKKKHKKNLRDRKRAIKAGMIWR